MNVIQRSTKELFDINAQNHIDRPLSNISIAYKAQNLIAPLLGADVPVQNQSDLYYIFQKGDFHRLPENTYRAPKALPTKVDFGVNSARYNCVNHALMTDYSYEDVANLQEFGLRVSKTNLLTGLIQLDTEKRLGDKLTSATNLGSGKALSGTAYWSDYGNSNPIDDIETGIAFIQDGTGYKPNFMIIGQPVWRFLKQHPDIKGNLKGITDINVNISPADIAAYFGIPKILIGGAQRESGQKGSGVSSFTYIWGNNVILGYANETPEKEMPSLFYKFKWTPEGIPQNTVLVYDQAEYKKVDLHVHTFGDEKITGADLGYIITSVVSGIA